MPPVTVTNIDPAPPISSDPATQSAATSTAATTPNANRPNLSIAYTDFVSAMPNLSTNLTSLGRAYHKEMNAPVYQAIAALQQSLSTLQVAMLQSELINAQSVIRTIRASSSLEGAKGAWSRFLNLPGIAATAAEIDGDDGQSLALSDGSVKKRTKAHVPGRLFTHKELWGTRVMAEREFIA